MLGGGKDSVACLITPALLYGRLISRKMSTPRGQVDNKLTSLARIIDWRVQTVIMFLIGLSEINPDRIFV